MPGPTSSVRMYLGNLPPDISEKNIRERLKSFGRAADVDIKHRKDHEGRVTATFAHFSLALVNQGDIEKCLQELNQKKWNGYTTKAEVAKESYLQRMEAKRAITTQQSYSNSYSSQYNQQDQSYNTYSRQADNFNTYNRDDNQNYNQYSNKQEHSSNYRQESNSYAFKPKSEETFSTSKYSNKFGIVEEQSNSRYSNDTSAQSNKIDTPYFNKQGKKLKLQEESEIEKPQREKKRKVEEDSSDSGDEVFWRKNFQAEKSVVMDTEEPRRSTKKSSLLSKFESFSSVWNDTNIQEDGLADNGYLNSYQEKSYQDEFQAPIKVAKTTPSRLTETTPTKFNTQKTSFNTHKSAEPVVERKSKTGKVKKEKKKGDPTKVEKDIKSYNRDSNVENYGVSMNGKIKWDPTKSVKQQMGEQKRVKSLAERMGVIQQQQEAVKKALAGQPVNKKIQFGEEEKEEEEKQDKVSSKEMAGKLFDDADTSEDEEKDDFAIKKQFEGKKGERLLELQSRFATDSRFRLDSRFKHSDSEEEVESMGSAEEEGEESEDEQKKQLSILDSILEPHQKITAKVVKQQDKRLQTIVRFDPSKPEHEQKYKKVEEPRVVSKKKKFEEAYEEVVMPEVSKERFYEVSNNLQQALVPKTDNFSLRALFGHPGEQDVEEENEVPEVEERKEVIQMKPRIIDEAAHTVKKPQTWSETFFFKSDDKRLQEGLDFFKGSKLEEKEDFEKRRHEMWMAVKAKLRNVAKKKVTFERKLGGKVTKNKRFGGKKHFRTRK